LVGCIGTAVFALVATYHLVQAQYYYKKYRERLDECLELAGEVSISRKELISELDQHAQLLRVFFKMQRRDRDLGSWTDQDQRELDDEVVKYIDLRRLNPYPPRAPVTP
jgi:hypothetical protein